MRTVLCLGLSATVALAASPARADDALDVDDRVTLRLDVEGLVRVQQGHDFDASCTGPCSLRVPRGYLQVSAPTGSSEVFVDKDSRVDATAGSPAFRRGGLVALIAGGAVVAVAVSVPLVFCVLAASDHPSGSSVSNSPCSNASDALKVAWISGAGVGLGTAIVGGTVFALSGPQLRVRDGASTPTAHLTPMLVPTLVGVVREGYAPSLVLTGRF